MQVIRIAFISGAYRSPDRIKQADNIRKAREIAKKYWKLGYAVICPHSNSMWFDEAAPPDVFIDGYLEMVLRLNKNDRLVMIPGWEHSIGALKEHALAEQRGIKIIYE